MSSKVSLFKQYIHALLQNRFVHVYADKHPILSGEILQHLDV